MRELIAETIVAWDEIEYGRPPSVEEVEWLASFSFAEDVAHGLEITTRMLIDRVRERRSKRRGREKLARHPLIRID